MDQEVGVTSDKRAARWLLNQLPHLTAEGILSPPAAEALRRYYGPSAAPQSTLPLVPLVSALLGSLLVGCGMILIIAHNWDELERGPRVALSFLPISLGIALSGYVLLRRFASAAWREGVACFYILAVGASISLVSQTYHIAGDLSSFTLTWLLLSLPVIYLLDSAGAAILCLNGVSLHLAVAPNESLLNWMLFLAVCPQLYFLWKANRQIAFAWLLWFIVLGLPHLVFHETQKAGYRISPLVFSGLYAAYYLLSRYPVFSKRSLWRNPLETVGMAGIIVYSIILTYQSAWKGGLFPALSAASPSLPSLLFCLVFPIAAVGLIFLLLRSGYPFSVTAAIFPVCAGIAWILSEGETPGASMFIMNAYALGLAVSFMVTGFLEDRLKLINLGMILVGILVIAWLGDSSLGFVVRGLAAIVVGIGFLTVNILFLRNRKQNNS